MCKSRLRDCLLFDISILGKGEWREKIFLEFHPATLYNILMFVFNSVEKNAERLTGLNVAQIRDFSPSRLRKHLEEKNAKRFRFVSEFPYIGRGNVLRESLVDSNLLNAEIDSILK